MQGQLSLGALAEEVEAGTIDTVVAAFPDMQGRLMGKRFHAEYFVESAHEETHGCNYLLADDIEMEPVPGYRRRAGQKGYGDFVLKPDLATLRRDAVARGHRAGALRRARPPPPWPLPHAPRAC